MKTPNDSIVALFAGHSPYGGIYAFTHKVVQHLEHGEVYYLDGRGISDHLKWLGSGKAFLINFPNFTKKDIFFLLLLLLFRCRSRYYLVIHEYATQSFFGRALLAYLFCLSSASVSVSYDVMNSLPGFIRRRTFKITQGSNIEYSPPSANDADNASFCVGMIGWTYKFDSRKFQNSLNSIDRIAENYPKKIHIVFLGASPEKVLPLLMDKKNITWTFFEDIPEEDFADNVNRCSLFVLPFFDGASSRRSSLVVPLVFGKTVITTRPSDVNEATLLGKAKGINFGHDFTQREILGVIADIAAHDEGLARSVNGGLFSYDNCSRSILNLILKTRGIKA